MACADCGNGGWVLDWGVCPVVFTTCPKCKNVGRRPKPYIVPVEFAPQGEDRWKRLHIGRLTAGRAHHVVTEARLELAKGRFTLMFQLAAERLLNLQFDRDLAGNEFIEHGREHEADAVWQYEKLHRVKPRKVSFMFGEDDRTGCSPDAVNDADDRYGCEVKCPQPPQMVRLHMEGPGSKYRVQMLHQFWAARFDRNDLFAFHPRMPPYWEQWNRDEAQTKADMQKVIDHCSRFNDELDMAVEKMKATGFFVPLAQPTTLLGELIAKMEREIAEAPTVSALLRWEGSPETLDNMRGLPIDERERLAGIAAERRAFMAAGA